jgi:septal ring factor EnvC (AmiA/AmiB activator)
VRADPLRRLAGALALAVGALVAAPRVHADDVAPGLTAPDSPPTSGVRGRIASQIAREADTLVRTIAIVDDKLAEADAVRLRRIRAAVRVLHAPLPDDATAADRMAAARRRAGARLLLERDAHERGLLAGEIDKLRHAQADTTRAAGRIAGIGFPSSLATPVAGAVSSHFGTYVDTRSHAKLSRRGIELAAAADAVAVAPADGVVRYAGPIGGLAQGAILDHGDYFTVLGELSELAVATGARIARGAPIGRTHDGRVYLEVRTKIGPGGLPIDPEPLLAEH